MTFAKLLQSWCISIWLLLVKAQQPFDPSDDLSTDADFANLANNSLYLKWRPKYHVLAANGHMNDPCGPMYDPVRQEYHIFYQSFPQHTQFGNTSWSHAVSTDQVYWTDVSDWRNRSMVAIATGPYPEYDWVGAFSGGAQSTNLDGEQDGTLTLMYTGASRFPDNWQLPYAPMTEQQAIATSTDGGVTWQKYANNPVITSAPAGWNVTGFRDPVFEKFPELDAVLGVESGSQWYMVLGSGIRGVGSRIPLYTAPANDLTTWTFQGALFEFGENATFAGDETRTGNLGYNFELAGLFPLVEKAEYGGDNETIHWVLTMGAEGYMSEQHPLSHWSLFAIGSMSRRSNGSLELTVAAQGVLDWAESYAFNQFYDPMGDRRINYGWVPDVSLQDQNLLTAQGFSGSLGLAREMNIVVYHNVLPPATGVSRGGEIWIPKSDGTYTVKTLSQAPLSEVISMIQSDNMTIHEMDIEQTTFVPGINSQTLHMEFTVDEVPSSGRFSLLLRASPDYSEYVNLTYHPFNHSIVWDSTKSSLLEEPDIMKPVWVSHFMPFTFQSGECNYTEAMKWTVFVDGSLVEIFVNDRFALSTRTYPTLGNATYVAFEASPGYPVTVKHIQAWQTMRNVWPARPENASSPLVFDGYCQTHLCFDSDRIQPPGDQIYSGYKREVDGYA